MLLYKSVEEFKCYYLLKVDSMENNMVEYKYLKNRVEWKCYRIM